MVAAIFLSSFATEVWHLILTQGILYGVGGNLVYYPIFIFIDEWFVRRKGFAFGVMWGGSGAGGLAGPLVLNWGLAKYGVETFLRGWAVALASAFLSLLFFPGGLLSAAIGRLTISICSFSCSVHFCFSSSLVSRHRETIKCPSGLSLPALDF